MKTRTWAQPGYIGADGRSRPSPSNSCEPPTVSFLLGFPAASFAARAVEHYGDLLPHAARACGFLAFRKTLAGNVFCAHPSQVFALRRQRHRGRRERFAETAEGHVYVWFAGRTRTARCFEVADRRGANPVRDRFLLLCRATHFVVVRATAAGRWTLQCSGHWMERPPAVGRLDSVELSSRFHSEQLVEWRGRTSL